jgi:hypothetical protein
MLSFGFSSRINVDIFRLYGQMYEIGRKFSKQNVSIKLDIETMKWEVKNSKNDFIKDFSFKTFDEVSLKKLTLRQ